MSHIHALSFDQWNIFFKNYQPIRAWSWLIYKITDTISRSEFTLKGSIATWRLFITRRFSCELNSSRTYFLRNISCRCNFNPTRNRSYTARKIKFSIKDFFSIFGQIRRKLWIWSYLPKKSLMQNLIFFAVLVRTVLTVSHP